VKSERRCCEHTCFIGILLGRKEITVDSNSNSKEEMKSTRNNDNVAKYKFV
jgi:hypothetical protein